MWNVVGDDAFLVLLVPTMIGRATVPSVTRIAITLVAKPIIY